MLTYATKRTENQLQPESWFTLCIGLALGLSVYYLNYGAGFDEGQLESVSPFATLARVLSIALIVWSLRPFTLRFDASVLLALFYIAAAVSFLLAIGISGKPDDILFFNTLLQLPVLIALSATNRYIDYARWLRFIGVILALQVVVDTTIWLSDASLWLSEAFIGGVGNPSSFGLSCSLLVGFYLLHPKAGSMRWCMVFILSVGAFMSKSLFAVIALNVVYVAWTVCRWQRVIVGGSIIGTAAVGVNSLLADVGEGQISFIQHKLSAAGALIGLVDYDVESSASVSVRAEIHGQTFTAIANDPLRLLYGHLEGKPYWSMDSQLLTYLGSFGVIMLVIFVVLHLLWLRRAANNMISDNGFSFISLMLFGFIFATNRILDYFPIATIYFILISMVLKNTEINHSLMSNLRRRH